MDAPLLAAFILAGSRNQALLVPLGLLVGLGLSSADTGARWPIARAVQRPELSAISRAALDMALGLLSAAAVALSATRTDRVGVSATLLLLAPLPRLIAAALWLPTFWTYPRDRAALHRVLAARREALLGES